MATGSDGRQPDPGDHQPRPWRRQQRDFAYAAWISFLMACAASAVFFAMVDPEILSGTTTPGWEISRQAGYAIGFFGFWLLTAATSAFAIWLVRTEPPRDGSGTRRRADGRIPRRRHRDPLRRRARRAEGRGQEERS